MAILLLIGFIGFFKKTVSKTISFFTTKKDKKKPVEFGNNWKTIQSYIYERVEPDFVLFLLYLSFACLASVEKPSYLH